MRLSGKVAIVTGATGGIGEASTARFLKEGASVMLVDLSENALMATADRLGGKKLAAQRADVSEPGAMDEVVARTRDRFGGVDVMFANAGVEGVVRPLADTSLDDFDRVMAVNVRGAFLSLRAAAPALAARGGGAILVTASVASFIGSRGLGPYCASKHAVMGLVKTAAIELAAQRIRVVAINPGPIDNRMMRSIEEQAAPGHAADVKAGFEAKVPLGRYGTNEEIAHLAAFLASDEASYCTGAAFVADGGFLAG
jgi:NAD(P)-dependent dehydrogenase (short-subunit alcohol dehydrogenase family)